MRPTKRRTDRQLGELLYVEESGIHGRGLFAARRIAKGEYIGTFAGPQAGRDGRYVLWVYQREDDCEPIGRRGQNMLRYLNHARPCNAAFDGFDLYACRTITPDTEITIDYGHEP